MPRPTAPNPYALLDSAVRELGKEHIRKYLEHTAVSVEEVARFAASPVVKKRKKRADAGKPRMKRTVTAPPKKSLSPKPKPRVQRAKPRVDPLAQITLSQEGAV